MKRNRIALPLALLSLVMFLSCEREEYPTSANDSGMRAKPATSLHKAPPDILVTTTSDVADFGGAQQIGDLPGPDRLVSLREAIVAANNTSGPQVIGFNIPTSDPGFDGSVFTIRPQPEQLPILVNDGTTIDGSSQAAFTRNTNVAGPEIALDGSLINPSNQSHGLLVASANNHIHCLAVANFLIGIGIGSADNNLITGCFVGVDPTGTEARPNRGNGIASGNFQSGTRIGGPTPDERNVISGNAGWGIMIANFASDCAIENNFIGTDVTGQNAIPNGFGIAIIDYSSQVMVKRNLISGNLYAGISLNVSANKVSIQGNIIGPDINGNILSGNLQQGIGIVGPTGHEPITNLRIGGPSPGQSNLISGNAQGGIVISTKLTDCLITRNIFTHNGPAILVYCNGDANTVRISENMISQNEGVGISLLGNGTGYTISRNKIELNGQLGIDLAPEHCCTDGVTPNDPGDVDIGPNNFMNFPVLISAHAAPGQLVVKGTIDTPNPETVTLEFFANPVPTPGGDRSGYGEGAVFLGTGKANRQGMFTATLPQVAPGTLISATATDAAGNTSEFAGNIEAKKPGK